MRNATRTKERIERSALRLFVERGVAGTSIRDIAAGARVSQGAMYNHYTSKDELASSLFAQSWAEIGAELRRRAREGATLDAKLRAMIGYVFKLFDEDWTLVTYVFLARHEQLLKIPVDLPNPYLVFRTVIVDAIQHEEIPRQNPDLATAMVMGAIVQVIDTKILGRIKPKLSGMTRAVARSCTAMLKG
jgi:AcrR family transcriptional regulator